MAAPAAITWDVSADFARTGGGTYATQLRSYIVAPFTFTRGVDSNTGNPIAGSVSFVLDNKSGIFTRGFTTGALYGKLLPGVPIRIKKDATEVWFGRIRNYTPSQDFQFVTIQCEGELSTLGRQLPTLSAPAGFLPLVQGSDSDNQAHAVMLSIGKSASDEQFTDGIVTFDTSWIDYTKSAAANISDAVRCEMATYPNWHEYWAGAGNPRLRVLAQNSALHTTPFNVGDDSATVKPAIVHVADRYEDRIGGVRVNYNTFLAGTAGDVVYQNPKGMLGVYEKQTIAFGGTITGGTFTLTWGGETTEAITWSNVNATLVSRIQSAINLILTGAVDKRIVADSTLVAGIGNVTVTFIGRANGPGDGPGSEFFDAGNITYTSSLTGTAPTITITNTTAHVKGKSSGVSDSISIPSKGTVVIAGPYITGLVQNPDDPPVATTNYRANDNTDGTGTDRTANVTVRSFEDRGTEQITTFYNDHTAAVFLTWFWIFGTPRTKTAAFVEFRLPLLDDPAAPVTNIDLPFVSNLTQIQKFANCYLFPRRLMRPIYSWQLNGATDENQTAILTGQVATVGAISEKLGALVNLKDTNAALLGSYVNDLVRVESEEITVTAPGMGSAPVVVGKFTGRPSWSYVNPGACIFDWFDRPDSTGLGTTPTGDVWTALLNNFNVTSGKAVSNTAVAACVVTFDLGTANFCSFLRLANLTGDTNERAGFTFRMSNISNLWVVYWDDGLDQIVLEKTVAGTTSIPPIANPAFTPRADGVMEIFLVCMGDRIRVNVDGQWIIDATDPDLNTNTKHGFFSNLTTAVQFGPTWFAGA